MLVWLQPASPTTVSCYTSIHFGSCYGFFFYQRYFLKCTLKESTCTLFLRKFNNMTMQNMVACPTEKNGVSGNSVFRCPRHQIKKSIGSYEKQRKRKCDRSNAARTFAEKLQVVHAAPFLCFKEDHLSVSLCRHVFWNGGYYVRGLFPNCEDADQDRQVYFRFTQYLQKAIQVDRAKYLKKSAWESQCGGSTTDGPTR